MPRIDDYKMARKKAVEELKNESFKYLANRSGFEISGDNKMEAKFLGRTYVISYPDFIFKDKEDPDKEIPLPEQVLILHYLQGKKPLEIYDEWISYREIPGASFYFGPFTARAINPMVRVFGRDLELFKKTCLILGGTIVEEGDVGWKYNFFPYVPIKLILWEGDDEFPPSGNILFDASIPNILSPEDVAWLSGMVVYRLIGISKSIKGGSL